MKSNSQEKVFIPFFHEDLDIKNELLKHARKLRLDQKLESILASSFIYASIAEYLAYNLLINLRHFVYQGTYIQYAAILFIDERKDEKNRNKTLGSIIYELKKYEFPDKKGILEVLEKILDARNNVFHNLAKTDADGLTQMFGKDIAIIQIQTEDLVNKINAVYMGLQKILIPNADNDKKEGGE